MQAEIEKIIRAYFDEAAGPKLEEGDGGLLFDHDSNWSFSPPELARQIAAILAPEPVAQSFLIATQAVKEMGQKAFANRPLPDKWRIGQKVRYLRHSEWAWSVGQEAYVKELRAEYAGLPAAKYQVFYTGPKSGSGAYWTTPDDVELVEDV